MKKLNAPLFLMFLLFLACDSEGIDPIEINNRVLVRIDHRTGDENWQEIFRYDNAGRLISIENQRSLGRKKTYTYQGDRLHEIKTLRLDNGDLIFRDSMAYDNEGRLAQVFKQYFYENSTPLASVQTFSYNVAGEVSELSTVHSNSDYQPRRVYHWQDGNVIKEDHYNADNILHEFYMTYDNGNSINLNVLLGTNPVEVVTRNNVVSTDWTDHTGLLDTACKPCTNEYTYDIYNYPISFKTNWGYSASFIYDELPKSEDQ